MFSCKRGTPVHHIPACRSHHTAIRPAHFTTNETQFTSVPRAPAPPPALPASPDPPENPPPLSNHIAWTAAPVYELKLGPSRESQIHSPNSKHITDATTPAYELAPGTPGAPAAPDEPAGPAAPAAPGAPCEPGTPEGPLEPAGPWAAGSKLRPRVQAHQGEISRLSGQGFEVVWELARARI